MKPASAFLVSEYFGKWLVSRKGAVELLKKVKGFKTGDSPIHVNFTGVMFISRSFADQLLKSMDETRTAVTFINPNGAIRKLLEASQKNYNKERKQLNVSYPHYTVKDKREYFEKLGID